MNTYKRQDIQKLRSRIKKGSIPPFFVIHGDRFLCRRIADEMAELLISAEKDRQRYATFIDGEKEDPQKTINLIQTYSLFPGRQLFIVSDSKLFFSKTVLKSVWDRALKAIDRKDLQEAARYLRQLIQQASLGAQGLEEMRNMSSTQWKNAFGFPQPSDLSWLGDVDTYLAGDPEPASAPQGADALYMNIFSQGIPENHTVMFLCETVDKRKKVYKFAQEHGVVIDLDVEGGSSKKARADQQQVIQELVNSTLEEFGKRLDPAAFALLLERIGFYPVAVVREVEKLALYVEDRERISKDDVDALIGRTREEAIFELTEAFSDRDCGRAIVLLDRMYEAGTHPLALVAALRNQIRRLMRICALTRLKEPAYVSRMNYGVFQKGYLPELRSLRSEWLKDMPPHPYAMYMMFEKAAGYSLSHLRHCLDELLWAEYRMKSSGVAPQMILESFFFATIGPVK